MQIRSSYRGCSVHNQILSLEYTNTFKGFLTPGDDVSRTIEKITITIMVYKVTVATMPSKINLSTESM